MFNPGAGFDKNLFWVVCELSQGYNIINHLYKTVEYLDQLLGAVRKVYVVYLA